jgi:hypothetical protein
MLTLISRPKCSSVPGGPRGQARHDTNYKRPFGNGSSYPAPRSGQPSGGAARYLTRTRTHYSGRPFLSCSSLSRSATRSAGDSWTTRPTRSSGRSGTRRTSAPRLASFAIRRRSPRTVRLTAAPTAPTRGMRSIPPMVRSPSASAAFQSHAGTAAPTGSPAADSSPGPDRCHGVAVARAVSPGAMEGSAARCRGGHWQGGLGNDCVRWRRQCCGWMRRLPWPWPCIGPMPRPSEWPRSRHQTAGTGGTPAGRGRRCTTRL